MAGTATSDVFLTPLNGAGRSLREWLTTFNLAVVALDPFTNEGAWILPIATRVLTHFSEADCRTSLLVTATPDEARLFLGPWVNSLLVFTDPDRSAVNGLGFTRLPAFAHIAMDGTVENKAEGWKPAEWQAVADHLAKVTSWSSPVVEREGDPGAF